MLFSPEADFGARPELATRLLFWLERTRSKDLRSETGKGLKTLFFSASRLERKRRNLKHSEQLLLTYLRGSAPSNGEALPALVQKLFEQNAMEYLLVTRHAAKLMHASGHTSEAFELLCSAVNFVLEESRSPAVNGGLMESIVRALSAKEAKGGMLKVVGKCLNRMAEWLQTEAEKCGEILLKNEEAAIVELLEERLSSAGILRLLFCSCQTFLLKRTWRGRSMRIAWWARCSTFR